MNGNCILCSLQLHSLVQCVLLLLPQRKLYCNVKYVMILIGIAEAKYTTLFISVFLKVLVHNA